MLILKLIFLSKILYLPHVVWSRKRSTSGEKIPKGNSQAFNKDKFSKPKQREHFTDEFLNDENENPNH